MIMRAYSNVGKREENQDSYYAARVELQDGGSRSEGAVVAVCDGMGGLADGKQASSEVIRSIRAYVQQGEFTIEGLKNSIAQANNRIYQTMNGKTAKSGTTATVLVLFNGQYKLFHVGDSRCYKITRDSIFHRLTEDHTAYTKYRKSGELVVVNNKPIFRGDEIEVKRVRKYMSTLTRAIGVMSAMPLDESEGEYVEGDIFLLASDGFWHSLERDVGWALELRKHFSSNPNDRGIEQYAGHLAEKFKSGGESDNLTTVMVKA